jgi:hypothetical protein
MNTDRKRNFLLAPLLQEVSGKSAIRAEICICQALEMKILLCAILLFPTIASAQFSGYLSSSYGYNANPLYNYAHASDQISQSYIDFHYVSEIDNSSLDLGYTGGLMLFNQFSERNYYEHSLAGRWNLITKEPDEETQEVDSTGAYLASELKFTARHDKIAFEFYDNGSGALNTSYRTMMGDALFLRFTNKGEYRSYKLVTELSNFTDILAVSLGSRSKQRLYFEILVSGGVKHYTATLNDTSTYETISSVESGVGAGTGKGKGQGQGHGNGNSGSTPGFIKKQHLYVNPEASNSWQYAVGGTISKEWEKRSAQLALIYRYSPTTAVRYVAQYVNTSMLTEDIYNDHFAYEGPEAGFKFSQTFPSRFTSALQLQWASKKFDVPALTLDGVQTGEKRKDTLLAFEMTISKAITISDGVDLEVILTGNAMRNRSNDEYNDFSGSAVTVGLALGF